MKKFLYTIELSGKSPCLPVFGPAFTPYHVVEWYLQSKEILLNLSMKCWNLAFNAQGSRVIIVVVQEGALKIYVAAMEALRKQERQMKLSWPPKLVEKLVWVPEILLCKNFHSQLHVWCPIMRPFSPANRVTLHITPIERRKHKQTTIKSEWEKLACFEM